MSLLCVCVCVCVCVCPFRDKVNEILQFVSADVVAVFPVAGNFLSRNAVTLRINHARALIGYILGRD
jgi:hypothetical protein